MTSPASSSPLHHPAVPAFHGFRPVMRWLGEAFTGRRGRIVQALLVTLAAAAGLRLARPHGLTALIHPQLAEPRIIQAHLAGPSPGPAPRGHHLPALQL